MSSLSENESGLRLGRLDVDTPSDVDDVILKRVFLIGGERAAASSKPRNTVIRSIDTVLGNIVVVLSVEGGNSVKTSRRLSVFNVLNEEVNVIFFNATAAPLMQDTPPTSDCGVWRKMMVVRSFCPQY